MSAMNCKILSFGELLIRFSPTLNGQWLAQNNMPFFVGGAELNVASALALWGLPSSYCTVLPDNYLSAEIEQSLQKKGINTSAICHAGNRIGTYYLPQGADLKNAGVIYDRAYSGFAEVQVGQINWKSVLEGVSWVHFSAINPAVSQNVAEVCEELLKEASARKITISIDLNYRAKLWQYGKQPIEVVPALAQYCNVIMGNLWAANKLLGISLDEKVGVNEATKEDYLQHSIRTALEIREKYPKCQVVANTFRFDAFQHGIQYYTTLFTEGKQFVSPEYCTETVIDKVGSGDCFMAGLIYGLYHQYPPQQIVDAATKAAFNKLQEYGDSTNLMI
jgi:2-dehydro-3-deoxygluconokinase